MKHGRQPQTLVLGLAENGYGIVRSLARAGVSVAGIYSEQDEFGRLSRFCQSFRLPPPWRDYKNFVLRLKEWARQGSGKPVLFPTDDQCALLLANYGEELAEHFLFHWVRPEIISRMIDKAHLSQLCQRARVLVPHTHVTRVGEDLVALAQGFSFPCLVKPRRSFQTPFPPALKNFVARSPRELLAFYESQPGLTGETIWQEIIEGGDEDIFQCTVLVRNTGEIGALFCARKIHQYLPGYGVMCFGRSEENADVIAKTMELVALLHYRGLASFEFKYQPKDGRYYFIEVNPRLPWYNTLFFDAGVNLPYLAYLDLAPAVNFPASPEPQKNLYWISFRRDLGWFLRTQGNGRGQLFSWLRSLARARSYAWWEPRDPLPWLRATLALGGLAWKRLAGDVRQAAPDLQRVRAGGKEIARGGNTARRLETSPSSSSETRVQVTKFYTWEEIQSLQPSWNELLAESSAPTIFLTWEWLRSWWSIHHDGKQLVLLACLDGDDRVVGLAPLYQTRGQAWWEARLRVLRLVGDGSGDSDNLDFIVRPGWETAVVRAWVDWLRRHRSEWDLVELNTVPAESRVAASLLRELGEHGWKLWRQEGPRLVIPLPSDWDTYLRSLSHNMRSAIVAKLRRLERHYSVRLRRCETQAELPACLETLFRLHRQRWELRGEQGTLHEERQRFYAEMARHLLGRGWLDFWFLDLDGRPVATELGFRYGDTHYFLQGGFDPAYSAQSAGFVLTSLILRELIRQGVRRYDFLAGEEPHKQRWGAERHRYYYLDCALPRTRGAVFREAAQSVEGCKAWFRAQLPAPAWKFLGGAYRSIRGLGNSLEMGGAPGEKHPAWPSPFLGK